MKIKAPLTSKNEVKPLVEAGADELYCGVEPTGWSKKFKGLPINQRSVRYNFTGLSDLEKAIAMAHRLKSKVHIAINAFFYAEQQYKYALQIIKEVWALGADGIILADLGLLINIPQVLLKNREIIIGTNAAIFNHQASNFFKNLGATRIVVPRANTISEIKNLATKDPAMEYEVFIMNGLCFFVEAFCAYCRMPIKRGRKKQVKDNLTLVTSPNRRFNEGCLTRYTCSKLSLGGQNRANSSQSFNFWKDNLRACGICALYDLKKLNISSLKICDRNSPTKVKIQLTSFTKKALDLLEERPVPRDEYTKKCKALFKKTFNRECGPSDCFYPSVFK